MSRRDAMFREHGAPPELHDLCWPIAIHIRPPPGAAVSITSVSYPGWRLARFVHDTHEQNRPDLAVLDQEQKRAVHNHLERLGRIMGSFFGRPPRRWNTRSLV